MYLMINSSRIDLAVTVFHKIRGGTKDSSTNPEYDFLPQYTGLVDANVIGIGEDRRSRSFPSHTTRHAGPHLAVR